MQVRSVGKRRVDPALHISAGSQLPGKRHVLLVASATIQIFSHLMLCPGVYIVQFDHFPPPSFEIIFFPPTNKFAAVGAKFFGVYDPKRCIFKAFSSVFM